MNTDQADLLKISCERDHLIFKNKTHEFVIICRNIEDLEKVDKIQEDLSISGTAYSLRDDPRTWVVYTIDSVN